MQRTREGPKKPKKLAQKVRGSLQQGSTTRLCVPNFCVLKLVADWTTQKPSEYMKEFLNDYAQRALDDMLGREAGPSRACNECGGESGEVGQYRCFDCHLPPILCKPCLFKQHVHSPFHFVNEWDPKRRFWRRRPLTELGYILALGHEGQRCPRAHRANGRPMCIVSQHGVHKVPVLFCACLDSKTGEVALDSTQLLRDGFWPSTWGRPETAFTVNLLSDFDLLSNQANVNGYDFFQYLRKKTNHVKSHEVLVCLQLFIQANGN